MNRKTTWYLLVVSAARNVLNHRSKSLVVGFILMFGAALVVVGTSLMASVETSMERTVTASLAGHLQVYSADAEDELALFGSDAMGGDDFGEIRRFGDIRKPLEAVPNVEAVVPMGITTARVVGSTRLDDAIGELRSAVESEEWPRVAKLRDQFRVMLGELRGELERRRRAEADRDETDREIDAVEQVRSDAFWEERLRRSATDALQFLDTEIAPLSNESRMVILRLLGTDPGRFGRHFDRFQVVEGQPIPEGKRGLLVSEFIWEHRLKNPVARGLDEIRETLREEQTTIAASDAIQSTISEIKREYRTLVFGLPPDRIDAIESRVRQFLPENDGDLEALLKAFLSVDDDNFTERYQFFYDRIAPLIELHRFELGEEVTLQSLGQTGFTSSANVKVWGVYSFAGLEDLELAGSMTLVDLVTFRELYGVMNQEAREEMEAIQKEVGVRDVDAESAEESLFGGASESQSGAESGDDAADSDDGEDPFAEAEAALESGSADVGLPDTYDPSTMDAGLARNAAVVLRDRSRLAETRTAIEEKIREHDLGLKVAGWQSAAGVVGQFVTVIRLVLVVSIVIIFLVALVIINNSMVMATVERTGEIGTLRAIGAQRWYVAAQFVLETVILGFTAGLLGAALGSASILVAGQTGIPASGDVLRFLFSGDYLYPTLHWWNVALGVGAIVVVAALSTLYPAVVATRVQPVVAMRD